ncbi:MAG: hypothetical protein AB7O52_07325 [Planctomycetota bacterium]
MKWKAITREEFDELFSKQLGELSPEARAAFDRFSVPVQTARIVRSEQGGEEEVFVVARCPGGVLYFDDVECGFNVGSVDTQDLIVDPGGSQFTLTEAVECWLIDAP